MEPARTIARHGCPALQQAGGDPLHPVWRACASPAATGSSRVPPAILTAATADDAVHRRALGSLPVLCHAEATCSDKKRGRCR